MAAMAAEMAAEAVRVRADSNGNTGRDNDLDLSEYGLLHYAVEYDMYEHGYGIYEVPVPGSSENGNMGFADVVDPIGLNVWEVKSVAQTGNPAGVEQLNRYINGLNAWEEMGVGYHGGYTLSGALNVALPTGQTYGVTLYL